MAFPTTPVPITPIRILPFQSLLPVIGLQTPITQPPRPGLSRFPIGYPTERQNPQERDHRAEAPHPKPPHRQDPWEQEDGERVEDDEHERDQVEADGELDPRVADRLGAALVALQLLRGRPARAQQARRRQLDDGERDDEPEEDGDRQVACHRKLSMISSSTAGPGLVRDASSAASGSSTMPSRSTKSCLSGSR